MEEEIDEDETVVDIDCHDKKNPLAVTEYIDDVYTHYQKIEVKSRIFLVYRCFNHFTRLSYIAC